MAEVDNGGLGVNVHGHLGNRIKELIIQRKAVWGAASAGVSELAAKATVNTGVDFLWIDLEHHPFEVHDIRWIPLICRMKGCAAMIRVTGLDSCRIKKALDAGANTIMVPQVNSAEEARLAVQYSKYPPEGTRGVSPWWTILLDVSWSDYLPIANRETALVVQIETPDGMKNLERISDVDGVDVVFAGPTDLSASMGHIGHTDHPEVQRFLEEFPRRVAKTGKVAGITVSGFDVCRRVYEQGYRFIAIGGAVYRGTEGLVADLTRLRELDA